MFTFSTSLDLPSEVDEVVSPGAVLSPSIRIDGYEICGLSIDLKELLASLEKSGEYFIFTCRCGEPGCAGVDSGILVMHHRYGSLDWLIPDPMQMKYDDDYSKVVFHRIRIGEVTDYRHMIVETLIRAEAEASSAGLRVVLPIQGMKFEDIMAMAHRIGDSFD